MQCPGVTSSRRGSTNNKESQIIAIALPPRYNDQGRHVLNGFTRRSHAVNDGGVLSGLCAKCRKSLCRLRKREELREGPLLTAGTEGTCELRGSHRLLSLIWYLGDWLRGRHIIQGDIDPGSQIQKCLVAKDLRRASIFGQQKMRLDMISAHKLHDNFSLCFLSLLL